jgi:5-methylcytosine-specific restriction endonuclease McrA
MRDSNNRPQCLLLNADYTPLKLIDYRRAIIWSLKTINENISIEILSYHNDHSILGADNKKYFIPSLAKTKHYFNIYSRKIKFSRKNLFIRDDFTCQYCGNKFPINQLTYDHVIPKSKYKKYNRQIVTNWNNIVTSCAKCNKKKKDRTPHEAGMILLSEPRQPTYSHKFLPIHQDNPIINTETLDRLFLMGTKNEN